MAYIFVVLNQESKSEIKMSSNMLIYNTELIWILILQNQSIFWTSLSLRPKYYEVI